MTASAGGYYPATQSTIVPAWWIRNSELHSYASRRSHTMSSAGGNDSNDGLTTDTAWATVSNGDAKGILNPGDTVVVDGYRIGAYYRYDSASSVPIANCSGTATRPITYTGINYGDIDTSSGGYGPVITANYIVFNGLQHHRVKVRS